MLEDLICYMKTKPGVAIGPALEISRLAREALEGNKQFIYEDERVSQKYDWSNHTFETPSRFVCRAWLSCLNRRCIDIAD